MRRREVVNRLRYAFLMELKALRKQNDLQESSRLEEYDQIMEKHLMNACNRAVQSINIESMTRL